MNILADNMHKTFFLLLKEDPKNYLHSSLNVLTTWLTLCQNWTEQMSALLHCRNTLTNCWYACQKQTNRKPTNIFRLSQCTQANNDGLLYPIPHLMIKYFTVPANLSSCKASDSPVDGCAPSNWGGIVGIFATSTFACPGATVIPGRTLDDTGTMEKQCWQKNLLLNDDGDDECDKL